MILTFSHIVDGQRTPLLDAEGREVSLSVDSVDRTTAMRSQAVEDLIAKYPELVELRVRRVE